MGDQNSALNNARDLSFTATIQAGQSALKILVLINGGAAVALLAFLGNATASAHPPMDRIIACIANAMGWYVGGVVAGTLAFGFTYLAQLVDAGVSTRPFWLFNTAAIISWSAGIVAFMAGSMIARSAFLP